MAAKRRCGKWSRSALIRLALLHAAEERSSFAEAHNDEGPEAEAAKAQATAFEEMLIAEYGGVPEADFGSGKSSAYKVVGRQPGSFVAPRTVLRKTPR